MGMETGMSHFKLHQNQTDLLWKKADLFQLDKNMEWMESCDIIM